ncbi:MAG: phospho-N-acetylmuramoyl-pentapeptide-transferase [Clostridia bacterium]|nr:phospho-N-acetylmuramoyl-pentapeptide-transferase [Clostridia bacterium]
MKTYLLAVIISALLTVFFGFILIPVLKRLKVGQPILKYVSEHKAKSGTATMGGILFVFSAIATYFIFSNGKSRLINLTVAITLGFLVIGFLDDFLKIKLKHNEGLTPAQKFTFQIVISLIASYFAFDTGLNFIYLPFTDIKLKLGVFVIPLSAIVFLATVNSVNLTDGLDGLCGSVSIVVFLALAVIIVLQAKVFPSYINDSEYKSISLFCVCMAGALLGYLVFNTNKASVFMGDTGSLAIGGALSTVATLSGNVLYIPIIGVFYLISTLSVIIQVIKFKRTGKRVFLMAPLHHHFQEKGHSESKIAYTYSFITLIISLLCILVYI